MSEMTYGPYGKDGEYVWIPTERLENARLSALSKPSFPSIRVQPNIAYRSPVDGKAVTTWSKRRYDLESNGCVDFREGKAMADDARRNWNTGLEGLTLQELEQPC